MCGISGAWRADPSKLERALTESLDSIRHRGPDGEGKHLELNVALGVRRLAIVDIEGGQQPIWNESNDVAVVFNGEIYNYLDLFAGCRARGHLFRTQADTEVLVHLYEEEATGFARRLRGMFSLAIFDRRRQHLVLARDRFGKKPLYYIALPDNGLLFASEPKALLPLMRSQGIQPEIDPQGIYDFLSLGSVPQPATIYRGVQAVPPGHMLIADSENIRIQPYWHAEFLPKFSGSYEAAQMEVRRVIKESVGLRLRSDVPLGSFLSAGIDSSIVTYEAAKVMGDQLQTFTVASEDVNLDESSVASASAKRFGVRNTVLKLKVDPVRDLHFLVKQYDQPFADPSAIPSLQVSKLAHEHVKVVLNGDGGDELFGGYRRHVAAQLLGGFAWVPSSAATLVASLLAPERRSRRSGIGLLGRLLRGLALPPEERYLVFTSDMLREIDKRPAWRGKVRATEELARAHIDPRLGTLDQQIFADLSLNLLSGLLVKMDIATSAYSLEGRSPFLDHELAELAFRLPARYRVRNRRPKAILRDAYADALGEEVAKGKKRGFEVPLAAWLQGPWRSLVHDSLGARDARVLAYVDKALVQKVLAPDTFLDRNKDYITYAFLVLELWLRNTEL